MAGLRRLGLASATLIGLPMAALAADLLPPLPQVPPPAPAEIAVSGWYLRGDVGVGAAEAGFEQQWNIAETSTWHEQDFGDSSFFGAGVGYAFNEWVRVDVTAEYRTAARLSGISEYDFTWQWNGTVPPTTLTQLNQEKWSGNVSSTVLLANAYVDLATFAGITPFVGAGVGAAYHHVSGVEAWNVGWSLVAPDPLPAGATPSVGGSGYAPDRGDWALAWAVHAGLGYHVSPNLSFELAYRYLNMGSVKSGDFVELPLGTPRNQGRLNIKDIESHDVKLGMRWAFANPAPAYVPPLVRNY